MAASRRSRALAAAGALAALLAPLALVSAGESASAAPKGLKTHQTSVYRVEQHLDLGGEYPDNEAHVDLSCKPGDIATDGMWRVDHVDQENPDTGTFGDERDVYATASYGDHANRATWHFRFANHATADAQVKLFVVCLVGKTTERDGHSHDLYVSNRATGLNNPVAVSGDWLATSPAACPSGSYPIAPGFNVKAGRARLFASFPTDDLANWRWKFVVEQSADIDVYLRCLRVRTQSAGGPPPHAHDLGLAFSPDQAPWWAAWIPVGESVETQLSCDDHAKAIVGAFWTDHPHQTWWLGQDPRPKTRAHRWWNAGPGDSRIYLTNLCLKVRTGVQVKP